MNQNLYIMCGIPGSGKSTYAHTIGNAIVVSSDRIRERLYGDENTQGDPAEVFAAVDAEVHRLLVSGYDVVYDATSISRKARMSVIKKFPHCQYICVYMDTPLSECLRRNAMRDRQVPNEVIQRMSGYLSVPTYSEGFHKIFTIRG